MSQLFYRLASSDLSKSHKILTTLHSQYTPNTLQNKYLENKFKFHDHENYNENFHKN